MTDTAGREEHHPKCTGSCGCWAANYREPDGKTFVDRDGWVVVAVALGLLVVGAWGLFMWLLVSLFG